MPLADSKRAVTTPALRVTTVTGDAPGTLSANRAYYPALDGLRTLAFLLVFADHYRHLVWGWTGVDLFFVLSGFLITGILFDTRHAEHRFRDFYVRRSLRIFPLYYGVFLALLLTTPWMGWKWNSNWLVWPAYVGNFLRFVHPHSVDHAHLYAASGWLEASGKHQLVLYLGHFWSLSVEEQFYLFWPAVVFRVRSRRRLIQICTATVVLMPFVRIAASLLLPQSLVKLDPMYSMTFFRLDALLLGGLIALLLRGRERMLVLKLFRWVGYLLLPASFIWLCFEHRTFPSWSHTWGITVVDLVAACLIVMALQPECWVYKVFKLRPLRWAGKITYGAYVFHDIPHDLYSRWADRLSRRFASAGVPLHVPAAAVALPCTMALAWLSFRYFETPFLRLKDRFTPAASALSNARVRSGAALEHADL